MRRAILAAALGLAATPAFAAPGDRIIQSEDGLDFVMPAESRLTVEAKGPYAEFMFEGAFTLTGTFTYGFSNNDPGDGTVTDFVFRPDAASARRLPHWPGGPAQIIRFSNPDSIIHAVVTPAQAGALQAHKSGTVSGRVSVRADSWHAVLGCGDPYYTARYLERRTRVRPAAPGKMPDDGDC